jgi:hypothetical protein
MFATLSGFGDKNCCPEALRQLCCVDAFVYPAVGWCFWRILVTLKIQRNTIFTKATGNVKAFIHTHQILPD